MSTSPILSISVPTPNRAELLRETLEQIENFDLSWEITVSDTRSEYHISDKNDAPSKNWDRVESTGNKADDVSKKSTFSFTLSDDDAILIEGITQSLQSLKSNQSIMGVYGNCLEWVRESGAVHSVAVINENSK